MQQIWNDIGESEKEKDRMLFELERECLEVYRRKVDEAANTKARYHQTVAAKEAELATLMAALGEHDIHSPVKINDMLVFEFQKSISCLASQKLVVWMSRSKVYCQIKIDKEFLDQLEMAPV